MVLNVCVCVVVVVCTCIVLGYILPCWMVCHMFVGLSSVGVLFGCVLHNCLLYCMHRIVWYGVVCKCIALQHVALHGVVLRCDVFCVVVACCCGVVCRVVV